MQQTFSLQRITISSARAIISCHISVLQLSHTTSLQAVAVHLSLNVLLTICCVCLTLNDGITWAYLESLVQLSHPLLLGGTFSIIIFGVVVVKTPGGIKWKLYFLPTICTCPTVDQTHIFTSQPIYFQPSVYL